MTPAEARRARMLEAYRQRHNPSEHLKKITNSGRLGRAAFEKELGPEAYTVNKERGRDATGKHQA